MTDSMDGSNFPVIWELMIDCDNMSQSKSITVVTEVITLSHTHERKKKKAAKNVSLDMTDSVLGGELLLTSLIHFRAITQIH
jgi:hypothetical protein